jgi:hypothetical protein
MGPKPDLIPHIITTSFPSSSSRAHSSRSFSTTAANNSQIASFPSSSASFPTTLSRTHNPSQQVQDQMAGIGHTAGQSDAILPSADNDRIIREFEFMSFTAPKKQSLIRHFKKSANEAALPAPQSGSRNYESYIASELVPNMRTHLDSVPFLVWKTKYEKEMVVAYKESVEPGFFERVARRQRGFLKQPESPASLEYRLLDSISHYENTLGIGMSDAEFESLITDM